MNLPPSMPQLKVGRVPVEVSYAPPPPRSGTVRALTIVLLTMGAVVTLRHLLYWTNVIGFSGSFTLSVDNIGLLFAVAEVAGYALVVAGSAEGLRGQTPAPKLLVIGAFVVAAGLLLGGATGVAMLLVQSSGLARGIGNDWLFMAWRTVSAILPAAVPAVIGFLLLNARVDGQARR